MLAAVTHYLCGNRVLKLINNDNIKDTITNHRNVFNLGTQGPDIFFYYGALPWSKYKGIPKLGNRIHKEKTGKFFIETLKHIIETDEPSKDILTAYLYGYICHYVLDCRIHPYVFYKTGFIRRGEDYSDKYNCYHRIFETALDVLMLKHEFNKRPSNIKVSERIAISKEAADVISEMYSKVLMKVYGIDVAREYVYRAITDMIKTTAALRDVTGIKKKLLSGIEKALGKPPLFSSMIMPLKVKDELDYLNISHKSWCLPWDDSQVNTSSIIENFEAAVPESKKIIEATLSCLTGKIDQESLMLLIGNRSFTTGEDCDLDLDLQYYDCVFE